MEYKWEREKEAGRKETGRSGRENERKKESLLTKKAHSKQGHLDIGSQKEMHLDKNGIEL